MRVFLFWRVFIKSPGFGEERGCSQEGRYLNAFRDGL
jgi:hypothetical protein